MFVSSPSVSDTVEHFLGTGEHDRAFRAWSGSSNQRREAGTARLGGVLRRIVRWRAQHAPIRPADPPADVPAEVRNRVHPLLLGMFKAGRAEALVDALPHRVEVLTLHAFATRARHLPLATQWSLANMLLDDLGAPPLADAAPQLDGLCADGRAWVLPRAFTSSLPYSDVVVHELAHLLHTLSPAALGLGTSRRPLVRVPVASRETFAYAVEVWSCIVRDNAAPSSREASLEDFIAGAPPADSRVDRARLYAILRAAHAEGPDDSWRSIRRGV